MNTNIKAAEMDVKVILATLWIFVMFNYLYCDVMSLMDPWSLKQYLAGNVGGVQITQGLLLGAAILMEIPIAMCEPPRDLSSHWVRNYRQNIVVI